MELASTGKQKSKCQAVSQGVRVARREAYIRTPQRRRNEAQRRITA
jgi:hypothetical protein